MCKLTVKSLQIYIKLKILYGGHNIEIEILETISKSRKLQRKNETEKLINDPIPRGLHTGDPMLWPTS